MAFGFMNSIQRKSAMVLVIVASLLTSSCVAQQADVVRIKRDLDTRISKLDKSKVELQQAVEDANRALRDANTLIATQRAEIKELLAARAEVMDQVTTIKDGDLSEVRGAIDQSEHHLRSVTQRVEQLNEEVVATREEAKVREQSLYPVVEQLKQQVNQQNEVVTSQAEKLSEFQTSFVDFREALDTVRRALVDQESKLIDANTQIQDVFKHQSGNEDLVQENWEQMKQSVDSVVSAFEQVSQTLANRLDEHERKLSQVVQARSGSGNISASMSRPVPASMEGLAPVQELRNSIASMSLSRDTQSRNQPFESSVSTQEPLFENKTAQRSIDMLDRSKVVASTSSLSRNPQQGAKPNDRELAFYQQNYTMLRAGDLKGAFQGFSQFLKYHPQSSLASNAQYWLGECYYGQQQYPQAIREFERVLTYYPTSHKVPAALLKIGYSHLGLQGSEKCTCRNSVNLFAPIPKSRAAAKAYARLTEVERYVEKGPPD